MNIMEEISYQTTQEKQPVTLPLVKKGALTHPRFSIKRLRKHPGVKVTRNPFIIG